MRDETGEFVKYFECPKCSVEHEAHEKICHYCGASLQRDEQDKMDEVIDEILRSGVISWDKMGKF